MDEMTNTVIYDSVAYSIGCQDNPEEYNDKMEDQKKSITVVRNLYQLGTWYYTYAPDSSTDSYWSNYIGIQELINLGFTQSEPPESYSDWNYKPYRPGYSSHHTSGTEWFYSGQSAGTDCVGLVQRSASYDGNPYSLPDIVEHPWTWNDGDGEGGAYPYYKNRKTLYYDGDGANAYLSKVTNYYDEELNKIMPGDIFYYYSGYHVAIVDRVEYKSSYSRRSDIKLEDIKLIEATWASDPVIGSVINNRTLKIYTDDPFLKKEWRIGRLKQ